MRKIDYNFVEKLYNDIAVELLEEFNKNFDRKAFFTQPWQPRQRQGKGSLMIATGALRRSLSKQVTKEGIRFTSSLPYANIHNEGGEIVVTKRMKRFFWAKYYEAAGNVKMTKKGISKTKSNIALSALAQFWKAMALKKEGSKIVMPQRRFIGSSPEVKAIVAMHVQRHLNTIATDLKEQLKPKK